MRLKPSRSLLEALRQHNTAKVQGLLFSLVLSWAAFLCLPTGRWGHGRASTGCGLPDFAVMQMWGLEHYDTWSQYFDRLDPSRLAPLTGEAQRWLYDRLHPPLHMCPQQKYYVLGDRVFSGLASTIHVATHRLAVALENGYLVAWHPDTNGAGTAYADKGCGRGEAHRNFLCFFEQPSSCGYEFVTDENSVVEDSLEDPGLGMGKDSIPRYWATRLEEAFSGLAISPSFLKFWWRAQAAAYLMRLNVPTRRELLRMRLDNSYHVGHVVRAGSNDLAAIEVPFPLPPGTASLHVRHGDKGQEMTLVQLSEYVRKVESFVVQNPLYFRKAIFLSSEDPSVISEARSLNSTFFETVPHNHWAVYYSKIHRLNTGPSVQLSVFGKTAMTHEWLLQLLMALECDAFVGTLGSNWNRLIAELRCVWIDSCQAPYLEVGPAEDWAGYNW